MKKRTLSAMALTIAMSGMAQAAPAVIWKQSGFDQPESVVADGRDYLYVSNIHGKPGEKDGQGYISKLAEDGRVIDKRWVSELNAPKGMGIYEGQLFVTDLDRLLVIDLPTGEVVETFAPDGAQFLNDVTVGADGDVYVSDMMGNAIYRYDGQTLSLWLQDEALMHPNGLWAEPDELVVAGWGTPIAADFSTEVPGGLQRIGFEDKTLTPIAGGERLGNLDGVVRSGKALFANDWMNGRLFQVTANGTHRVVAELSEGVADIGVADDVLYLPYMFDGEVRAVQVP